MMMNLMEGIGKRDLISSIIFFFRLLVARKETFLAVLFIYSYGSKSKVGEIALS